jgi:acyl carrier protein
VREAVVLRREDRVGDPRLVAYVVPREAGGVEGSGLQQALRRRLPEYMVPSGWVMLERLPLSPSGKVDRRALPAPDPTRPAGAGAYQAPATAVEQQVAAIWQEVLGLERVGRNDNFFELGGHSLLATQVVSRLRQALGVEVPLRHLFEQSVLAEFASLIIANSDKSSSAFDPIEASSRATSEELIASLGNLSEEEIDTLLRYLR